MEKIFWDLKKYNVIDLGGQIALISDICKQWLKVTPTGFEILKRMDGSRNIEEIANELSNIYDIPQAIILDDCQKFLNDLEKSGLLMYEKNKNKGKLYEIYLDITNVCHYKCKYCFKSVVTDENEAEYMTYDSIVKAIKEIQKSGVVEKPVVYITGGEPLRHPEIDRIFEFLKSENCFVILCTDGRLINKDKVQSIKKFVDMVMLPLESHNEKVNDELRGKGSFKDVSEAIEILNLYEVPYVISITPVTSNINKIKDIISFAYEKKALGCILNDSIHIDENGKYIGKNFNFSKKEMQEMNDAVSLFGGIKRSWRNNKDKQSEEGIFYVIRDSRRCGNTPAAIRDKDSCGLGINEVYISSKGYSPCHMLNIPEFRRKSFEEVKEINVPYNNMEDCKQCNYSLFCLSGCRARAYYDTGAIDGKVPNCEELKEYFAKFIENVNGNFLNNKEKE